ncbi:hypothetical protein EWM64_g7599 [Hericium alpestre]|uniref:Uncharacterized protein n=1 Tax=Hericium alpestre TaxID=135208 RepID=A0A4Y9ZQV8_9AGAM|nr:hypothetical protein EWM64_g7599 [Hericium alpestre]
MVFTRFYKGCWLAKRIQQGLFQICSRIADRNTPERVHPVFPELAELGVPKELMVLRPEVLAIIDEEPLPEPDPNASPEQARALYNLWKQEDELISNEYCRIVEGIVGWYKKNESQLSPGTCARIEGFLEPVRRYWYRRTVNW